MMTSVEEMSTIEEQVVVIIDKILRDQYKVVPQITAESSMAELGFDSVSITLVLIKSGKALGVPLENFGAINHPFKNVSDIVAFLHKKTGGSIHAGIGDQ